MRKKLIFIDIDGTFLAPGASEPPASALEAIRAAQAAGHRVFLCTGRNLMMTKGLLRFGFDGAVCSAGGYILLGDEVVFDCPLARGETERMLAIMHEHGMACTVEALEATFSDDNLSEFFEGAVGGNSEFERWHRTFVERYNIRPLREYDGRAAYKLSFMFKRMEQLEAVERELGADYVTVLYPANGGPCRNGEFINRKFDKGRGMRRVCEALGADIRDTIAIGDSMNDREMIQTAGVGVCMGNGDEALKRLSDFVCPTLEEDGFARAFRELQLF